MVIPGEFLKLVGGFWQGSDEEVETLEAWAANGARLLPAKEAPIVRDYLRKLLASNPSNAELIRIWAEGGSSYGLLDHPDTRRLFELLLAEMEKKSC